MQFPVQTDCASGICGADLKRDVGRSMCRGSGVDFAEFWARRALTTRACGGARESVCVPRDLLKAYYYLPATPGPSPRPEGRDSGPTPPPHETCFGPGSGFDRQGLLRPRGWCPRVAPKGLLALENTIWVGQRPSLSHLIGYPEAVASAQDFAPYGGNSSFHVCEGVFL